MKQFLGYFGRLEIRLQERKINVRMHQEGGKKKTKNRYDEGSEKRHPKERANERGGSDAKEQVTHVSDWGREAESKGTASEGKKSNSRLHQILGRQRRITNRETSGQRKKERTGGAKMGEEIHAPRGGANYKKRREKSKKKEKKEERFESSDGRLQLTFSTTKKPRSKSTIKHIPRTRSVRRGKEGVT